MTILAFVFGACIGSFLNVLIWRLPREKTLGGRSQCPHCHHTLSWYDLFPVLSFVVSGARCRYCQKKVSYRYPAIEIITGLLFALAILHAVPHDLPSWLLALKLAVIVAVCITVFVIDLEHYLILDKVVYPAMVATLAILVAMSITGGSAQPLVSGLLSAAGAFIPFWLTWYFSKGKWMGFGDVKLVAWIGLVVGWPGIIVVLFLSFTSGAIVGILLIIFGKKQMSSQIPFGTFLSVSTIIAAFCGPQLWALYMSVV